MFNILSCHSGLQTPHFHRKWWSLLIRNPGGVQDSSGNPGSQITKRSPLGGKLLSGMTLLVFIPLCLSGCFAPLVVGGAGTLWTCAAEDRGVTGAVSDEALRYRLNQFLDAGLSDFSGIELTVYKGHVLFTGIAANEQVRQETLRIAGTVPGVKQITDGMITQGEDGVAEYSRDAWITAKLKTQLYIDEDIVAPNYVIRTFNRTTYIFGTAQCQAEVQKVLGHASEISGIKRVVPLIQIAGQ